MPECRSEPLPSRRGGSTENSGAPPSGPFPPPPLSVAAMVRPSWRGLNPITRTARYFARLHRNFGWRFILILLSAYVGVRGVAHRLVLSAYLPYMRETAGVTSASLYQAYFTVLNLPWSLKATIGLLSDVLPLGGYHKRNYIIASVVLGSTACAILAGAPIAKMGGGVTAAVLLFFLSLQVATGTCLGESGGKEVPSSRGRPARQSAPSARTDPHRWDIPRVLFCGSIGGDVDAIRTSAQSTCWSKASTPR